MKQVKLKDITTKIGSGATPLGGKNSYKTTGIALIRSLNIFDLNFSYDELAYITDEQAKKLNNVTLEPDDVLLNITGASVARCCILPQNLLPARVNQHVSIVRINKELANPYFVQYLLVSPYYKQKLLAIAQGGATREALTKESIENFEITIPNSKKVQDQIAKVLSNYDDLIENNNKRIKILEEMTQKIYKEWFVDFKFPGHETATFKQTELGEIPSDWEVSNIEKYYNTSSGGTPSRKQLSYYDNGKINWIKTGELKNTFVIDTEEKITEEGIKNSSAKIFPVNTVVLAMYCGMGDISIMSKPMATNQACCVFLPKYSYLEYPFSYLFFSNITKEMTNISFGAAQQNLSQEVIKAYNVKFPNKEIVQEFNKIIKPVFANIKNLLYKNKTLKQTRDLLLPHLISGEIDVENLEII